MLARQAATEAGASEAIFVRDGAITEGTHTTVFAVIGGVLRTHPANHLVLPGVTREVVLGLARDAGVPVREAAIRMDELPNATELFLSGTTTDVTPVVRVDDRVIGDGAPGPIARALLERLLERMGLTTPALASARDEGRPSSVDAAPRHSPRRRLAHGAAAAVGVHHPRRDRDRDGGGHARSSAG